jgi:serine/threonine protein kinase
MDLELAHAIGDSATPFTQGTVGFISPQQQKNLTPDTSDDVFSVGAIIASLLTGLSRPSIANWRAGIWTNGWRGFQLQTRNCVLWLRVACAKRHPKGLLFRHFCRHWKWRSNERKPASHRQA